MKLPNNLVSFSLGKAENCCISDSSLWHSWTQLIVCWKNLRHWWVTGSHGLPLSSLLPLSYSPSLLIFFNDFESISLSLPLLPSALVLAPSPLSRVLTKSPNQIPCPVSLYALNMFSASSNRKLKQKYLSRKEDNISTRNLEASREMISVATPQYH